MGKRLTLALAVFAMVVVPIVAYVAGYFWLGDYRDYGIVQTEVAERIYPQRWEATIHQPAGRIEAALRGISVDIAYGERLPPSSLPPLP